ncbi:unnamed protein product [Moneuplotes crassus]|uniref:Alpha/beta hydrolase fold-3 domain-containing protein n=1 Tax=Euplotes crassus TaxID=5936 RepID=A0AAD1Y485_EUPCR|nr:unnamed protein product [Moneuplotes crassus]
MEIFKRKKTIDSPIRTPQEAFVAMDEKMNKLMQPNEKIHVYNDDDLIHYLHQIFDVMAEIEQEMNELVKITDYANFKEKCEEFATLCDTIKTVVDICIDNLQHFTDFKRLSDLKEQRDKGTFIFDRLSKSSQVSGATKLVKIEKEIPTDDYDLMPNPMELEINSDEIEEARSQGIFDDLLFEQDKLDELDCKLMLEEEKYGYESDDESDEQASSARDSTVENLNNLVLKRIDDMMHRAKSRNPLGLKPHEERIKAIKSGKFKICVSAVALAFKYIYKMFTIILNMIRDSVHHHNKKAFMKFMVYASKFTILSEVIFAAFYANPNDLLFKNIDHPDWTRFFSVYDYYQPKDLKKFNKQYKGFCHSLALASAFISKAGHNKNSFTKAIGRAKYAAYFLMFKKKRLEQFDMFMSNPDIDLCLKVYNMPETDFVQKLNEATLPKIKLHKVIYLSMTDEILTLENLKHTSNEFQDYLKHIDLGLSPKRGSKKKSTTEEEPKSFPKTPSLYHRPPISASLPPSYHTNPKLHDPYSTVMVRVLSPFAFPVDWKSQKLKQHVIDKKKKERNEEGKKIKSEISKSFWTWLCGACCGGKQIEGQKGLGCGGEEMQGYIEIEAIMIHIHGGGFVSMSSSSHQNYTRKWANEIGIPIFSIDYRLAPEHPYPAGLNDVWQAYSWIVNNCTKYFGIKPKKILISGDSAGGNLTIALTMLAIEKHFRVPDFIVPVYPAMNLSLKNFCPSLILSLDDFILPSGFLYLCVEAYVKDGDPETDHFLSPGICPDNILQRFPPTRIMSAGNDPLRDEAYKFVLRLLDNGVDVTCKEYINFPHGFISLNIPVAGISECKEPINQAIKYFKEFIYQDGDQEVSAIDESNDEGVHQSSYSINQ